MFSFKMARLNPSDNANTDKPLPTPGSADNLSTVTHPRRPGTAGTENILVTNRRRASENLQRAQRAEKQYKTRKRAAAARRDYGEAKTHFSEAWTHIKAAVMASIGVLKSSPYLVKERNQQASLKREERRRVRGMEKRRRLEEALAREEELARQERASTSDRSDQESGEEDEDEEGAAESETATEADGRWRQSKGKGKGKGKA